MLRYLGLRFEAKLEFMQDGDMESYAIPSELSFRDVYDSKAHDYRYSRDDCSAEPRISYPQPRFLVFWALIFLYIIHQIYHIIGPWQAIP